MVNIQIIKPAVGLEQYIDCFSFCKGEFAKTKMKIIANSCTTLFIYLNGSKHNGQFNNKPVHITHGIISPFSLRRDTFWSMQSVEEIVECVTVMFSYVGFYRLFGMPMKELYGSIYDISDISLPGFKEVVMKIEDTSDNISRTEILNKYFIKQFTRLDNHDVRYTYMPRILSYIGSEKGKLNVSELCEKTCMTERTLENWFKTCIGGAPREFINIVKFHNLLHEIYNSKVSHINWQDLIHNYRYFDQAHLINVFKDATSVTPEYFFQNRKNKLFLTSNGSGCLFFNDMESDQMLNENTYHRPE
jgi:AraC-like DNA-binding protein